MKGYDILSSRDANSPTVRTRSRSSTCRVGSVFILNQESKGIFKQINSGWRRHVNLVAGGLSSVCVVVDPPGAEAKRAAARGASAEIHAVSNDVLRKEDEASHGTSQQRKRCGCAATTSCCTGAAECRTNQLHLCSPNGSQTCCGVFTSLRRPTSPTVGREERDATILNYSCVPQAILKRRCDTESNDKQPMQVLLRLGNKGIDSSSQLRFPAAPQIRCSVSACENRAASHLSYISPSPRVVHISVGSSHTLACDDAGSLYSWEDSLFATGPRGRQENVLPRPLLALRSRRVVSACASDHYSLAVTDEGDVYSWGTCYLGQLGRAVEEVAAAPRFVPGLMRTFITGISCNETHVVAHSQHGDCFSWGSNDCGQLGLGVRSSPQAHPQRILFRPKTKSPLPHRRSPSTALRQCGMSGGPHASNAPLEGSQYRPTAPTQSALKQRPRQPPVAACDPEFSDKLHNTDAHSSCETVATACCEMREAFSFIVAVAAGWRHSLALTADGDVYTWGLNTVGQLGVNHCQTCYAPVPVPDYEGGVHVRRRRRFRSNNLIRRGSSAWAACTPLGEAFEAVSDDCSHCICETLNCSRREDDQTCAFPRPGASHFDQVQTLLDEDEKCNGFARDRRRSFENRGDADYLARSAAEACNRSRATQAEGNGLGDAWRYLRAADSDRRPADMSTLRVVNEHVPGAHSASLSQPVCHREEIRFQDPCITNNLASGTKTHATILQICAGQLFSAFLSSDGCVFLAGQSPGAQEAAGSARLVDRTQRKYESDSQGPSCNMIPASVPGLEDMAVTEIASSKNALVAFVPSQVLGVHPSLVPLPSPKGPSVNLRVTVTALPNISPSLMPLEHEAGGPSEAGTVGCGRRVSSRTEHSAERDNELVEKERLSFRPDSHYSEVFAEGHRAEPLPHDSCADEAEVRETGMHGIGTETGGNRSAASAKENKALMSQTSIGSIDQASEACRAALDSELTNGNRRVHNYEEYDVLVRFRRLAPPLPSAFTPLWKCAVVRGRVVEKAADEQAVAAEIDCTCPTLLHSNKDTNSTFETDRANLADDTEAHYFQPETPRAEAAVQAYHEAGSFLQSQEVQVLSYAVEVSVDGGCCWSNAEFNRRAASVLFAKFPEEILAVCPNNVTTKGGLALSIFLDYIPFGIPQENIVVKFICVYKYQDRPPSSSCILYLEQKSPSNSSRTPAAAVSEKPSHNSQMEEYSDRVTFNTGKPHERCDGGERIRQPAVLREPETDAASGNKTDVEENSEPEPFSRSLQGDTRMSEGVASSAGAGHAASTTGPPAVLPCGARGGGQDFCYYVLVPARIVTQMCGSEISHRNITHKLALQCSSPALDESVAEDFDLFVDVALNGVNFTGKPLPIHVLEAEIVELVPNVGFRRSDTKVYIQTRDQCDSSETVVLLKHDDGHQQVVPVAMEAETRQLYFIMPQRRSLTPPPAEDAQSILEFNKGCTDKNDSSGKRESADGTSRTAYRSDVAPAKCSTTPGGEEPPANRNNTEMQSFPISVHLSFNGQAFSPSGKVFLHYDSEPVVVGVLAYTIADGGELFEADLENVITPGTIIVISLQSAVLTSNAQARLTVLKNHPTCSYPLLAQSASTGAWDMEGITMQQEAKAGPRPEAVERVIFLPAVLEIDPHRIVLQSDHTRVKKKSPALRAALADNGGKGKSPAGPAVGNGGAAGAGATAASRRNAGNALYSGAGGAAAESSTASNRVKSKAVAGPAGGPAIAAISGAGSALAAPGNKMPNKKHEKPSDLGNHADAEDEKTNGPTLTVTVPAITLESQQSDTSTIEGALFAFAEISLDGQHFVPMKQCPLLRLQCIRVSVEGTCAPRPTSSGGPRLSQGKAS